MDEIARAKYKGNSWSAWNDVTLRHRALLDAILQSSMHVIVTMRSKTETAQVEENGRKKVAKLGMKAEQRDGFEYEMTVVLDITHDGHFATASKDRTRIFTDQDPRPITEETGQSLLAWLEAGADAPDIKTILQSIAAAETIEALKGHFGAAWQMLDGKNRDEAKAAYDKRKTELTQGATV